MDHPSVAEAAVCGRNDATTGQAIVAYVTLKGGEDGTPERLKELRDHVGRKIGRFAAPREVGAAISWLCSDAASFVTGIALSVDGGWTAQ